MEGVGGIDAPRFPGGLYFAECSSKADEYTSAPCAMLLAPVDPFFWHELLVSVGPSGPELNVKKPFHASICLR